MTSAKVIAPRSTACQRLRAGDPVLVNGAPDDGAGEPCRPDGTKVVEFRDATARYDLGPQPLKLDRSGDVGAIQHSIPLHIGVDQGPLAVSHDEGHDRH